MLRRKVQGPKGKGRAGGDKREGKGRFIEELFFIDFMFLRIFPSFGNNGNNGRN